MHNLSKQTQQISNENKQKLNFNAGFTLVKPQQKATFLIGFMRLFKISDQLFKCMSDREEKQKMQKLYQSFYCKTLKKVQFQENLVILHLKKIKKQPCSTKQFVQYLRNLDNQFFDELTTFFQYIHGQENQSNIFKKNNIKEQGNDYDLETVLQALKGKSFFMCVKTDGNKDLFVQKIILSKTLLSILGYKQEQMKMEFLKYKDVKVEFLDKGFYQKFLIQLGRRIKKTVGKQILSKASQGKQPFKKSLILFQDFLYKRKKDQEGEVQKKLQTKIQFYKPFSEISVMEFQINNQNPIEVVQILEIAAKKRLQEQIEKQELKSLKIVLDC